MITTPASRLVPAGEPGHAVSRYESVLSGASLHGLPGSLATRDGRVRLVEWEARGLPDVDGATDFVVFIGNDITDRVRAEARYYELFESASDMIVTTNLEGQVDRANRAAEALTGRPREVLLGSPVFGLLAAEHRDQVREASLGLRAGGPPVVVTDLHLVTPAGERVAVEASINLLVEDGTPSGYQAIFRDVTARQAAERERLAIEMKMQDAQRLESLGVLAGGIAHDFNNLLTVIIGNVSYLKRVLAADGSQREIIEEIEGACRHAADLAQQMLAYSGKGRFVTQRIELNQLYREIAQLLHASIGAGVTLSAELVPTLPAFEGDLTQVRQVVMNLIVNASDAIGEGVGSITARTGTMQADRRYLDECLVPETLPEGEYVYLEVADTGRGMDAATVARIFDPFFTTKATGRGLGLAAVLGILRAHRGTLRVWSEQGIGTTFRVLLPLGRDDAAALQGATAYD
jgi:PAS domain S-box-containing protein